jgi:hypothetical protein
VTKTAGMGLFDKDKRNVVTKLNFMENNVYD